MKKTILLIFIIITFFYACRRPVEFSVIPEIKLISFEKYYDEYGNDVALLVFYFQDGDGDIGLDGTEIFTPTDSALYEYNFFCDYYEKQNGIYVKIDSIVDAKGEIVPCNLNSRIPRLSKLPEESIHGEIYQILEFYYDPFSPYNDTIQLRFFIVDRKLNHSNIEVADMIR